MPNYVQASRMKKKNKMVTETVQDENLDPNENCSTSHGTSRQPANKKMLKRLRKKCKLLSNKCRRITAYNSIIITQKETNRKKYQRAKKEMQKTIDNLNLQLEKLKARQEILESTIKKTYQSNCSKNEKTVMQKLVRNSENKNLVSKMLGLKFKPRAKPKKIRRIDIKEITQFYLKDDVSRNTAGKKETRTKNKEKVQIRYLLDTLVNTFKKYKSEGGRYGFTTFYKHKPFYVLSPGLSSRNTCLCIKHSNFGFLHTAMVKHGLVTGGIKEIMSKVSCDTNNYNCMWNKCRQCKDINVVYEVTSDDKLDQPVEWSQWERVDHIYQKNDGETTKEMRTKKTAKVTKTGTLNDLKNQYEKDLVLFKKHHFNMIHQQAQYQKAITGLKQNEALIVCDFSENYDAKLANEVQSMHYGASNRQISLHTGMVFWKDYSQSFCTISDNTSHQPGAIWAHLIPIIDMIKQKTPDTTVIHFFSDGPSSQYRQKKNFYLLAYFTAKYGLKYTTWSFYEAGHGKNVADGIGGSVKRTLDKKVCCGNDVVDAKDAHHLLKQSLRITKVFLIDDCEIDRISNILPATLPVLKGTMQLHQIMTSDNGVPFKIKYRHISCFCGDMKGQCGCFSPQPHSVTTSDVLIAKTAMSSSLSCASGVIPEQNLTDDISETITLDNQHDNVPEPDLPLDLVDICVKPFTDDTPELIDHAVFPLGHENNVLLRNNQDSNYQCQRNTIDDIPVIYVEENHESLPVEIEPVREDMAELAKQTPEVDLISIDEISVNILETDKTSMAETISNRKSPIPDITVHVKNEPDKRCRSRCHPQKKILHQAVEKVTTRSAKKNLKQKTPLLDNTKHTEETQELEKHVSKNRTRKQFLHQRVEIVETRLTKKNQNIKRELKSPSEEKQIPDKRRIKKDQSAALQAVEKVVTSTNKTTQESMKCKQVTENTSSRKRPQRLLTSFLDCNKCLTSILGQKGKCIVCQKWYCTDCIDGNFGIDYICDSCLEGELAI
ncbi:uncharacterized protein LOC134805569 [Cydia splendana]|uniref:uncharacterized protein LOC134805569 n=1 Tax=Cydia splendana TaxID=1100963 RepID=UPI00300CAF0A